MCRVRREGPRPAGRSRPDEHPRPRWPAGLVPGRVRELPSAGSRHRTFDPEQPLRRNSFTRPDRPAWAIQFSHPGFPFAVSRTPPPKCPRFNGCGAGTPLAPLTPCPRSGARREPTTCSVVAHTASTVAMLPSRSAGAVPGCVRGGRGSGSGNRPAPEPRRGPDVMCLACKADPACEHSLRECSAIEGAYCIVCHHDSSLPGLAVRRAAAPGRPKARPSMAALLREIRQRRGRRRA